MKRWLQLIALGTALGTALANKRVQLSKEVSLPEGYDKGERPNHGKEPLKVQVHFRVNKVLSIDDKLQTITVIIIIHLEWEEPRLNITSNLKSMKSGKFLGAKAIDKIWIPYTTFLNLVDQDSVSILNSKGGVSVLKDKKLRYTSKSKLELSCPMDFDNFPFDNQTCEAAFISIFYNNEDLILEANIHDSSKHGKHLRNLSYTVKKGTGNDTFSFGSNMTASQTGFTIELKRDPSTVVLTYYLPCFGIVLASFMSFIISPSAVPGRVSLLVTLYLVLITWFATVQVTGQIDYSESKGLEILTFLAT